MRPVPMIYPVRSAAPVQYVQDLPPMPRAGRDPGYVHVYEGSVSTSVRQIMCVKGGCLMHLCETCASRYMQYYAPMPSANPVNPYANYTSVGQPNLASYQPQAPNQFASQVFRWWKEQEDCVWTKN